MRFGCVHISIHATQIIVGSNVVIDHPRVSRRIAPIRVETRFTQLQPNIIDYIAESEGIFCFYSEEHSLC